MKEKKEKEKVEPLRCKCGKAAVLIKIKGGKYLVSCSDPMNCVGNFITFRHSSEEAAIKAWNILIKGAK